jgi:RNA polymerase sigma factor (sigma-70 family)
MAAVAPAGTVAASDATLEGLYERHADRVFGYCLKWLRSREEAEDAAQTTFLYAMRGLRRGVKPDFEPAWLLAIARNVCLTRTESSRRRSVEIAHDPHVLEDSVSAPMVRDDLDGLAEALGELTELQRRAIVMREWQGLSYREIAEELDLSQAAVETLLFRARRALAARLRGAASFLPWVRSLGGGGAAKLAAGATIVAFSAAGTVAVSQAGGKRGRAGAPATPAAARADAAGHTALLTPSAGRAPSRRAPVRRHPQTSRPVTPNDAPLAPGTPPVAPESTATPSPPTPAPAEHQHVATTARTGGALEPKPPAKPVTTTVGSAEPVTQTVATTVGSVTDQVTTAVDGVTAPVTQTAGTVTDTATATAGSAVDTTKQTVTAIVDTVTTAIPPAPLPPSLKP